jgi:hypothetical protein
MELMHNQVISIMAGNEDDGIYRVIIDEPRFNETVIVRIDGDVSNNRSRGGRAREVAYDKSTKKRPLPLVGELIWKDRRDLMRMFEAKQLHAVEIEPEAIYLSDLESERDKQIFAVRLLAMKDFLDISNLQEQIVASRGLGRLVSASVAESGLSRAAIYKLFSLLCRHGFTAASLRPRLDRCGAPGVARPCDPGGRKKAGTKTIKQRIAKAAGIDIPPDQPGMSSEWRDLILAADNIIDEPKPPMPDRIATISNTAFVKKYNDVNGKLVPVNPEFGTYPNQSQIRRMLEQEIPRLDRLRQTTTQRYFTSSMRGLTGKSWEGVPGPGHTWAIDSTIGDIYLRSSVNRAWIIGRPIVYIIVDVWSTAVVGFYVCLTGPSWDMAKVALFSASMSQEFIAGLWGYQPVISLAPAPTLCANLLCDRGEYYSKAAFQTGARLIPIESYTPPYRPDLKGLVEVLHRIKKNKQYFFVPGTVDARRKEFELRGFKPHMSVFTIREYTQYLYILFTNYNLTANREHRLDAHMRAMGVTATPAGLWRWGHDMGVGVQRAISKSELITSLLPSGTASVTRDGVTFAGRLYTSEEVDAQKWTTHARNFGGWNLAASHFPGSVSRIWVPNKGGSGMLNLELSDCSTADRDLTFDEVADAYVYSRIDRAEKQHSKFMLALQAQRQIEALVGTAKALTDVAVSHYEGPVPTLTESRQLEHLSGITPQSKETSHLCDLPSDGMRLHLEMMNAFLDAANSEVLGHV